MMEDVITMAFTGMLGHRPSVFVAAIKYFETGENVNDGLANMLLAFLF
jgi:hypothetical protein